jgi:hypothetical protein
MLCPVKVCVDAKLSYVQLKLVFKPNCSFSERPKTPVQNQTLSGQSLIVFEHKLKPSKTQFALAQI